jgi:hypothetical protein
MQSLADLLTVLSQENVIRGCRDVSDNTVSEGAGSDGIR